MWYLVLLCWVDIVEHRTSSKGESGTVGMNLKTFLFFAGIFVQLALNPYFAFISISNSGRLTIPKAQLEYFRLKAAILDWEVHNHYWTALRDPTMSTITKSSDTSGWTKFVGSTTHLISLDIKFLRKSLIRK